MTLPNFIIIGAAKSGTTSLYYYLKQHPEVFITDLKEPHFFGFEGENLTFKGPGNRPDPINTLAVTNLHDYYDLFKGVTTEKAIGEASPSYLHTPKAADRIKFYSPHAKLIAILRNPVDRAYSAFTGQRLSDIKAGVQGLTDFEEALQREDEFIRDNWCPIYYFKKLGFYYEQLEYYLTQFDREQIHICLTEDLQKNPSQTLQKIYRHIGVDESFVPDFSMKAGTSGLPKNKFLYRLSQQQTLKKFLKPLLPKGIGKKFENAILERTTMAPETRQELQQLYREDILKLQDLIDRDLSAWLV